MTVVFGVKTLSFVISVTIAPSWIRFSRHSILIRRGRVLRKVLYRDCKLVLGIPAVLISFDVLLDQTF